MNGTSLSGIDLSPYLTGEGLLTLLRVGLLLFLGIPLVFSLSSLLRRVIVKSYSAHAGMIASKISLYTGMALVFVTVLHQMGFRLTALLGAAGLVGVAMGFAAQTSVSNIISGFFLVTEQAFIVGDVITVGDVTGSVLSIDMLSVKLRTFDNRFVRIPNETLVKNPVANLSHFPIRRVDINVGVAYKEDIARVRDVLLEIARKNPLCLEEPEPLVIFSAFGNSSIDFLFAVWALKENFLKLKNSIAEEIKRRFDEEEIEMPFPHVSLYAGSQTEPLPVRIAGPARESSTELTPSVRA